MEWVFASALAFAVVYIIFLRKILKLSANEITRLNTSSSQARAADNALVLAVLAREVANELMQRDAADYRKRFERLYYKWKIIEGKNRSDKLAHLQTITSKFTTFLDFDELGTKAHVLYADGFGWKSNDDLWDLYESIRLYDALSCDLDDEWKFHGTSVEKKELDHLKEYCVSFENTKILAHLHKARRIYFLLSSKKAECKESDSGWIYETEEYKICRVPHYCENRYGVYIKDLDRYGMWGVFYDDVSYTSFYTSDATFDDAKCESLMDVLHIRVCVGGDFYKSIEKKEL